MVSAKTLCKKLLNVKGCVIENLEIKAGVGGTDRIRIAARPSRWHKDDCPICHRRCPRYDSKCKTPRIWRGLDWEGIIVEVEYKTHRIVCPEHGVLVADDPWAYPGSRFTKNFDLTVGWLAVYLPKSAVAEYMRIDWETVGRCVHRTLNDIEPMPRWFLPMKIVWRQRIGNTRQQKNDGGSLAVLRWRREIGYSLSFTRSVSVRMLVYCTD